MIRATIGIFSQGGVSFDADAQAFFDRVDTAGGTLSATEKEAVNTLVEQMKADGIWSSMKAIYPMVGASAAACAQNLKSSSFTGTFSSGWSFSSSGAKPNGTSAYMDTALNWSNETDLDNAAFGSYWTDYSPTSTEKFYGGYDASGIALINQKSTSGPNYINSFTAINANMVNGFHAINRSSSTSIDFILNSSITSNSSTSSSKFTKVMWLGGVSSNTQFGYVGWNYAFSFFSEGLTNTEWGDFYTAVQAFQTTLSRNV